MTTQASTFDITPASRVEMRQAAHTRFDHTAMTVAEIPADAWDGLAARFDDAVQEQLQSFYDYKYPRDAFRRLAVYRGDALVAAAIARRIPAPIPGLCVHQIQAGPLWRLKGHPSDPALLPDIHRAICDELALRNGGLLLVLPRAEPDDTYGYARVLADLGFKPIDPPVAPERYFVNVAIPAEAVLKSFKQKTRAHVRKGEKAGLTASFDDTVDGFDIFYGLYEQMVSRKGLLDYNPVLAIRHRLTVESAVPRPRIIIVRKDDEPVAAAVIDRLGDRATYLYGASSSAALPLKAGFFMQWKIIEYLCDEPQIVWYDLIGANSRDSSLHQFKRGLIGTEGKIGHEASWHWIAGGPVTRYVAPLAMTARGLKRKLRLTIDTLRGAPSIR